MHDFNFREFFWNAVTLGVIVSFEFTHNSYRSMEVCVLHGPVGGQGEGNTKELALISALEDLKINIHTELQHMREFTEDLKNLMEG